ncbi:ligase-associated DNA damage response endonuclease PdeM [Rubellicoccus peritrichatus]|uniref:Ligase-associated DNA damage response endonuclease PdeM n=1 Tax=Rubellicoccus peritrichatus TaxID=3080537 RepID=A0AAQ3LEL6_9BACT|nr:ligase-associated DNA damage response endonuclease PdeM [Puniceicoccus sp. CR14]WOO42193.1 ligase-associated DNA damage response endonuclease PdeM [Puniceicoccus sp. CR14]
MERVSLELAGSKLELLPQKVVYLPAESTLLVADIHLGKSASHRGLGLYLPQGADAEDLERLRQLVRQTRSQHLIILGDLFHDRQAMAVDTMTLFENWLESLDVEVTLVIGNHDRKALKKVTELPISIRSEAYTLGSFLLAHEPQEAEGKFTLCGHLHPGVRVKDSAGCAHRAKAFWLTDSQLVLPAFGSTTSMATVAARAGDRFYVCADDRLFEVRKEI